MPGLTEREPCRKRFVHIFESFAWPLLIDWLERNPNADTAEYHAHKMRLAELEAMENEDHDA